MCNAGGAGGSAERPGPRGAALDHQVGKAWGASLCQEAFLKGEPIGLDSWIKQGGRVHEKRPGAAGERKDRDPMLEPGQL